LTILIQENGFQCLFGKNYAIPVDLPGSAAVEARVGKQLKQNSIKEAE
jgi:hypothetical protein